SAQGIFWRKVPIRRRKERRSLNVWIVIGTSCRGAKQLDSQLFELLEEKKRLLHIQIYPAGISPKGITVSPILSRNTSFLRAFLKRNPIKNAHSYTYLQSGCCCANA